MQSYANQLERSNAELQDFAYVASHDLQEPLRKIEAFSGRLRDKVGGDLDEKASMYLERMQDAASRMRVLINDLLTFSRVTSKGKAFSQTDCRVTRRIHRMLLGLRSKPLRISPLARSNGMKVGSA